MNFGTRNKVVYNKAYEMEMLAYKECDSKETVLRRKGIYGKF